MKQAFKATSLRFHSLSEHTIDGQRFDLEMQALHKPDKHEGGFFAGTMSILFDTYHYDETSDELVAVIDNFFESLKVETIDLKAPYGLKNPKPEEVITSGVPYGQLMHMVASDRRFIYKGSLTTPPCTESVYWNVLSHVYPIKVKHLDAFRKLWPRYGRDGGITNQGNYRMTQPRSAAAHQMALLGPIPPGPVDDRTSAAAVGRILCTVFIVLFAVIGGLTLIVCTKHLERIENSKCYMATSRRNDKSSK